MRGAEMMWRVHLRCLSVSQQSLLLLEFLNLLLIRRLGNQLVDVAQVPLGGDLEASILLANAIATSQIVVRSDGGAARSHLRGGGVFHGLAIRQRSEHVARGGERSGSVDGLLEDGSVGIKIRRHTTEALERRGCSGASVHSPGIARRDERVGRGLVEAHVRVCAMRLEEGVVGRQRLHVDRVPIFRLGREERSSDAERLSPVVHGRRKFQA